MAEAMQTTDGRLYLDRESLPTYVQNIVTDADIHRARPTVGPGYRYGAHMDTSTRQWHGDIKRIEVHPGYQRIVDAFDKIHVKAELRAVRDRDNREVGYRPVPEERIEAWAVRVVGMGSPFAREALIASTNHGRKIQYEAEHPTSSRPGCKRVEWMSIIGAEAYAPGWEYGREWDAKTGKWSPIPEPRQGPVPDKLRPAKQYSGDPAQFAEESE